MTDNTLEHIAQDSGLLVVVASSPSHVSLECPSLRIATELGRLAEKHTTEDVVIDHDAGEHRWVLHVPRETEALITAAVAMMLPYPKENA